MIKGLNNLNELEKWRWDSQSKGEYMKSYIRKIVIVLLLILSFNVVNIINFIDIRINPLILVSKEIYFADSYFEYELARKNPENPSFIVQSNFSKQRLSDEEKIREIIEDIKKYNIYLDEKDIILRNKL